MKRLLLTPLLLLAALAPTGCSNLCTQVAVDWGVAGCGETQYLNNAPELHDYDQSDFFPEVGHETFFDVTARDVEADPITVEWDFESDGRVDEVETYPSSFLNSDGRRSRTKHRFDSPAINHLTVRASDFPAYPGGAGVDTMTRRFRVHTREEYLRDRPPVAAFTTSADELRQFSVLRFDASASSDPDGDRLYFRWLQRPNVITNSGLLSSPFFSHAVDVPGRFEWQLIVYDDYGKNDAASRFVNVLELPQAPHDVGIHYEPSPVLVDQPLRISVTAGDPNNDIARYEWDLDDQSGYERTTTEPRTEMTYSTAGVHSIGVRVVDATELSAATSLDVEVFPQSGPAAPSASLLVEPNPALTEETVRFSAAGSTGPAPETAQYQWDLDGDGAYESVTREPVRSRSYDTAGDYLVRVRVIHVVNGVVGADVASRLLRVNPGPPHQGPVARLDVAPNPALVGQTVTFDAAASTDPDDDIVSYEWDLDGFPGYEVEPDGASSQEQAYDDAETFTVGVRVTDADANSDEARQTLRVDDGSGSGNGRVSAARRRSPSRAFSAVLPSAAAGRVGRLRATLGAHPKLTRAERLFKRFQTARWRAQTRIALSRRDRRARVSGVALAARGRDRACLRVSFDLAPEQLPRGTFTVLGGTGAGAKLHGTGSFRFQIKKGKPAIMLGHLRADRGRARGLPAGCRRLARR